MMREQDFGKHTGSLHVLAGLETGASFGPGGVDSLWRYTLFRTWLTGEGEVAFLMLNPSTADHTKNDPTITRTIGYAKLWGYRAVWGLNAFAYRSTDPGQLKVQHAAGVNIVGEDNDDAILAVVERVDRVVLAWGTHGATLGRQGELLHLLKPHLHKCHRLGELTKEGFPRHPLYCPNDIRLIRYSAPALPKAC